MARTGHLHHLDGLRGIAALWVAIYHTWTGGHIDAVHDALPEAVRVPLIEQGFLGVPVFFVLSGFVIPYAASREPDAGFRPLHFMHRRWRRLSPPYYAALVLTVLLGVIEEQVRDVIFDMPSPTEFLAHVLYLQDLADQERIGLIFWTLAFEMQFYILFAAMKWVSGRVAWPHTSDLLLGVALVVSAVWAFDITDVGATRGVFLDNWYLFLVGQAVFVATQREVWRIPTAVFLGALLVHSVIDEVTWTGAGVVTAGLVWLLATTENSPIERLLATPASRFVGLVSYSLYLTHGAVAGPGFYVVYEVLGRSTGTEWLGLVVVTVGQLVFAWIWYQGFEKPSMTWSKKIARPVGRAPASA